jgi:hypothetical protein
MGPICFNRRTPREGRRAARATKLALCLAAFSWAASSAAAFTPATGAQRSVILNVVREEWRSEVPSPCPADIGGPTIFHVNWARVSSIYPEFAYTSVKDDGCTYTVGYVLRRPDTRSRDWHVVARQLDSAQSCSEFHAVNGAVLNEFGIEGNTGEGELHLCGPTSGRPWCEQFAVAYAVNTTCAVESRVAGLYGDQCIPKTYRSGPLPPCRRTLAGFKCRPSGDAYAVINCVDGRRRVGLHLAE